jgi:hypothetical protein
MNLGEMLVWIVILAFATAFNPLLGLALLLALLYSLGQRGTR